MIGSVAATSRCIATNGFSNIAGRQRVALVCARSSIKGYYYRAFVHNSSGPQTHSTLPLERLRIPSVMSRHWLNRVIKLAASLMFMAIATSCSDQGNAFSSDFAERSVDVDGKTYQYRVFVPAKRDPNKKLAVMLYLHGSGA